MTQTQTQTQKNIQNYFKTKAKSKLKEVRQDYKDYDKQSYINYILSYRFYRDLLTNKQINMLKDNKLTAKQLKDILLDKVIAYYNKEEQKQLNELNKIYAVDKVKHGKIEVEWVKNRTWGNCPRGCYRNCFEYVEHKAVTGCGYDKLSTLTADFLNNDLHFKRVLIDFIDRKKINTNKKQIADILGYGIRTYEGLPYLEGAVGAECHVNILKKLGFNVQWHEAKKMDLFIFDIK